MRELMAFTPAVRDGTPIVPPVAPPCRRMAG